MIVKVNEFWVPENDIHIEDWKAGQPFTQNKCLLQFKEWCRTQHKKFRTVIDVGAWCGTWASEMSEFADSIKAFEPNATNFKCLERKFKLCAPNCFKILLYTTNVFLKSVLCDTSSEITLSFFKE